MGILDVKERVLDSIITVEGKKALANGGLNVHYVSFSDLSTFYTTGSASGSATFDNKIVLEASSFPHDQLVFFANDAGKLNPFGTLDDYKLLDGKVITSTFLSTTSSIITASNFVHSQMRTTGVSAVVDGILSCSVVAWQRHMLLSTKNRRDDVESMFSVGPSVVTFNLNDLNRKSIMSNEVENFDDLETLIGDPRFSKVDNFAYLPPINRTDQLTDKQKVNNETSAYRIGDYESMSNYWMMDKQAIDSSLEEELKFFEKRGFSKNIMLDDTQSANLIAQFFEVNAEDVQKLDVVDFGYCNFSDARKRVFFVGKMLTYDGRHAFVNVFTLVVS